MVLVSFAVPTLNNPSVKVTWTEPSKNISEGQEAQIMDLSIERGNGYCWAAKGAEGGEGEVDSPMTSGRE